jgi:carboxymethylenebutenolidase
LPSSADRAKVERMQCTSERVTIPGPDGRSIRSVVFRPSAAPAGARLPGVLAYSDIFQLTGPHLRMCHRLAGHGFVVVAPEIFSALGLAATAFDFEADRQLALDATERMTLADFDADRRAVLAWMQADARIDPERIGACGWCIGGHLAFRAAQEPAVKATACFYATGLHTDTVGGAHGSARSLAGATDIGGPLLMVWGSRDPHIPAEGRATVHRALADAGTEFSIQLHDAEHTFMRDEGARHDPVATDRAFAAMLDLFSALR